jgi:uncharacterized protein YrrD
MTTCWVERKEIFRMRFSKDANVFTADGEKVGEVERVVINPRINEVTHIVVRQGFLFTEDKVVPVDLIASATDERVALREDAGDLDAVPNFEEEHYIPLDEMEKRRTETPAYFPSPVYWYPPYYTHPYGPPGPLLMRPVVKETEQNIPEGTVALEEGARVLTADGEHVGDVEQVLTEPQADRVTHFVIAEGLLFKDRKLVPYHWVTWIGEQEVHLAVGSSFLESLPEYTG